MRNTEKETPLNDPLSISIYLPAVLFICAYFNVVKSKDLYTDGELFSFNV